MEISRLPILSRILTHLFKKKVTVTVFNCTHYTANDSDENIDIHFDTLLPTERKLFYRVLYLVRETLCQGKFVAGCLFEHRNAEIWELATRVKLPFKWTSHITSHILPEGVSEDSLQCTEDFDDVSIARVYTLKYSIAMKKKICRSDYSDRYSAQFEQLREDKNTQQTAKICESLQDLLFYETALSPLGKIYLIQQML